MSESSGREPLLEKLVEYSFSQKPFSESAYTTARLCLFDAIGCLMAAHKTPATKRYLGPLFHDKSPSNGARVLGTSLSLDPMTATFENGLLLRWLDFNDTFLAKEWAHPSDNLAVILSLGDSLCQKGKPITVKKTLDLLIRAYEVQGLLSLDNSFNQIGLDHVILVKVASAMAAALLYEVGKSELYAALSHAFCDFGPLRAYRHAPNVTPRKCWAAGDMSARGLFLAKLAMQGEMALPLVLSAPKWGLNDLFFKEKPLHLTRELGSYVVENILFKIASPTEFHAQTALEAAKKLHKEVKNRIQDIDKILIETHQSALRIIAKEGPLNNPQDRDHCIQYVIAIGLLFGFLKTEHYEIETASLPEVDLLRSKMMVKENRDFSKDYLNPNKRSAASSIEILYKDGSRSQKIIEEYPLGHPRRREETRPLLLKKFENNCKNVGIAENIGDALALLDHPKRLDAMLLSDFIAYFIPNSHPL